jgi:hypothetical protein
MQFWQNYRPLLFASAQRTPDRGSGFRHIAELENELLLFPDAPFDHQVDSVAQYLLWHLARTRKCTFEYEFIGCEAPRHRRAMVEPPLIRWGRRADNCPAADLRSLIMRVV